MAKQNVWFVLGEQKIPASYDRNRVAIGSVVHALTAEGVEPEFSPGPQPGFAPYCITWIATSDWTIWLENRLTVAEQDVERIASALGGAMSTDDIRKALYYAAGLVSLTRLHRADTWHNSIPGRCLAVAERLHLVSHLRNPNVESVAWWHSESLVTYLLLTCFDLLGQKKGWKDFGGWLNSKQGAPDLSAVKSQDLLGSAKELHQQWLDQFGTRNSFFNFVKDRLDDNMRQELLDSFDIIKYPLPPVEGALSKESRIPTTDDEKLKYLYRIRNSFTHQGVGVPGKFPGAEPTTAKSRGQAIDGRLFKNYITSGWPDVLVEAVKFGLVATLTDQLSLAPQALEVPLKLANGPGRRSYV